MQSDADNIAPGGRYGTWDPGICGEYVWRFLHLDGREMVCDSIGCAIVLFPRPCTWSSRCRPVCCSPRSYGSYPSSYSVAWRGPWSRDIEIVYIFNSSSMFYEQRLKCSCARGIVQHPVERVISRLLSYNERASHHIFFHVQVRVGYVWGCSSSIRRQVVTSPCHP